MQGVAPSHTCSLVNSPWGPSSSWLPSASSHCPHAGPYSFRLHSNVLECPANGHAHRQPMLFETPTCGVQTTSLDAPSSQPRMHSDDHSQPMATKLLPSYCAYSQLLWIFPHFAWYLICVAITCPS